jgi:hypothetical protein
MSARTDPRGGGGQLAFLPRLDVQLELARQFDGFLELGISSLFQCVA